MQQIVTVLFALVNKVQIQGNKCSDFITVRQWMGLLSIMHIRGEASYNMIACKLGTTKQNVKELMVPLAKKGYVTIEKSGTDRRANNVVITEQGKIVIREFFDNGNKMLLDMTKGFSQEELEIMWQLLKKLYSYDGVEFDGFEEKVATSLNQE